MVGMPTERLANGGSIVQCMRGLAAVDGAGCWEFENLEGRHECTQTRLLGEIHLVFYESVLGFEKNCCSQAFRQRNGQERTCVIRSKGKSISSRPTFERLQTPSKPSSFSSIAFFGTLERQTLVKWRDVKATMEGQEQLCLD